MENTLKTIDKGEEDTNKISDKIEGSKELRAEELAEDTDPDSPPESGEAPSPLLRLPGEIRNQIYGYLIVDCNVRFSTHFLPGGDVFWHSRGFSYSPSHIALTQINHQIREEVCSYILDHGTFHVKVEHLSHFDQYLESEKKNRIGSVVIDVAYQKPCRFALGDAMTVTTYLGPLCSEGKLNHIVVSGFTGWHDFIYPNVLVERVDYLLFKTGERGVRVEEGAKRYVADEEEEEEEEYGEEDEDENEYENE